MTDEQGECPGCIASACVLAFGFIALVLVAVWTKGCG